MLERLKTILTEDCELDPHKIVLVGVSGGPDSIFLLDILVCLNFPVIVAHLNHELRPGAHLDAQLVEKTADQMGVQFVVKLQDVTQFAELNALSIEEAGRMLRYRFLFEEAERAGAQAVAVAHTADDQAETVLMHFLRGAGLSGLRGMGVFSKPNPWSQSIPLIRPLLGIWREEIEAYIIERGLETVRDQSNDELTYYRNRLRHELIPYLKSYNPGVKRVLWRTAQVVSADYQVLDGVVESAWQNCLVEQGKDALEFSRARLLDHPIGVRRQVLRKAVNELRPGLRDIDFESVERAIDFIDHPTSSGQIDLVSRLRLVCEGDRLWLATWEAEIPRGDWPSVPEGDAVSEGEAQYLEIPGVVGLENGWKLSTNVAIPPPESPTFIPGGGDPFQAWLDADSLELPLQVRRRKPGDRFQPLGMAGHKVKLADYMINVKMPRRARGTWPLVFSGDELAWLPGYQIGHPFRLTDETRRVAHLSLSRNSSQ